MKTRHLYYIILVLCMPVLVLAQTADDVVRPFIGLPVPGSRAEGLGQAYTALSNDFTGAYYNPAGLATVTRAELYAGGTYLSLNNSFTTNYGQPMTGSIARTYFHLNAVGYLYPVAQTKFTLGVGYFTASMLDRAYNIRAYMYRESTNEESALGAYTITGGYQLNTELSVGMSLNFYSGNNTYDSNIADTLYSDFTSYQISSNYSGIGLTLGFLWSPASYSRTGISITTPIALNVDDNYTEKNYSETSNYRIQSPLSFSVGQAVNIGPVLLAGNITWRDWSLSKFTDTNRTPLVNADTVRIEPLINSEIRSHFASGLDALEYGAGGEYLLPFIDVKLRGGVRYVPGYRNDSPITDRWITAVGASAVLAQQFKIEFSYSQASWKERFGSQESAKLNNAWATVTFSYRF